MTFGKRLFDIFSASLGCLIVSPLIVVVAILVRIKLGSPVLFKQRRPGLHTQPFYVYKFRTMTDQRDANGNFAFWVMNFELNSAAGVI